MNTHTNISSDTDAEIWVMVEEFDLRTLSIGPNTKIMNNMKRILLTSTDDTMLLLTLKIFCPLFIGFCFPLCVQLSFRFFFPSFSCRFAIQYIYMLCLWRHKVIFPFQQNKSKTKPHPTIQPSQRHQSSII